MIFKKPEINTKVMSSYNESSEHNHQVPREFWTTDLVPQLAFQPHQITIHPTILFKD